MCLVSMNSLSSKEFLQQISVGLLSGQERPITVDEACAVRLLLFGNTIKSFSTEWIKQGFKFRTNPSYALRQLYAGPCGIIAAVQAYVLHELIYSFSRIVLDNELLRPTVAERKEALARALSRILWQAGQHTKVFVAIKSDNVVLNESTLSGIIEGDGILEYVKLKYFDSFDVLVIYINDNIQHFMDEEGCIIFLYSVILTHGIDKIREEMDYPESHLIGNDGYCSLEVINLILIAKAVPNVFNGDMELNSGGTETTLHKGIPRQSKIGLLSLYEYQGVLSVGSYYKDPNYPIWVLQGESHFSVLFGTSKNIFKNPTEIFKLYYIDCIKKNNEEITLTINPIGKIMEEEKDKPVEKPPVFIRCIYTRWPLAEVEVNVISKEEFKKISCKN